jgi:hypothetical protein
VSQRMPRHGKIAGGRSASSNPTRLGWAALNLLVLLAGGCALTGRIGGPSSSTPAAQGQPNPASSIRTYLNTIDDLARGDAARQADVFYEVERDYTRAPTTSSTLRYAIAKVTPGHPAANANEGKRLLETLLATPERMTAEEHTLAAVLLHETNARLKLEAENRRLLATLDERNRSQANSEKRVQVQLEENARLRRALAEAQQKLDAIKEIERSIIERSPTPPGSRDTNASETQGPSTSR